MIGKISPLHLPTKFTLMSATEKGQSLVQEIAKLLISQNKTLSVAESCTGGKISSIITSVSGSSNFFKGGIIAYSNQVKINKLRVYTKIGVSILERKKKQLLLVSIKFSYKVNNNKNVDNINNLISYTDIKKFLKTYIESSRCQTLEKLIIDCSQIVRRRFKIQNVSLEIEKPEVAKKYGCQSISVSK